MKTIQLFSPNGDAQNLDIVQITGRTVQATQLPRKDFKQQKSASKSSRMYFLLGDIDDYSTKPPASMISIHKVKRLFP